MPSKLPIDEDLLRIASAVESSKRLVLVAPPGSGKTTRVPTALLAAGSAGDLDVVVLEPRRLAARMAARRVAAERSERVGQTIGYEVRFDRKVCDATRVRFVTEGVLLRQLVADPTLAGVGVVVLDEFHERHLAGDLSLALLARLTATARPDLKIVVMSATLDTEPIASFLGGCPVIESSGRSFEVQVDYAAGEKDWRLSKKVSAALRRLLSGGIDGHVLVFLPGAAEIRRAREACAELAEHHNLAVHALHGAAPPEEQDRAVAPSERKKLILATNVAETSITIEGVAAVIDSGVAKVARHSPWSGVEGLSIEKVSRASAVQRAGRAGRTSHGRCLRLYTRHDFETRRAFDAPEVLVADMAEPALALHAAGHELADFPWFEAPPAVAITAAEELLESIGAVASGQLTELGREMVRVPAHPRQARVLIEAAHLGARAEGAVLAALVGERPLIRRGGRAGTVAGPSDLLESMERFIDERERGLNARRLASAGLDTSVAFSVDRASRQLMRIVKDKGAARPAADELDGVLLRCILAGYPDRVARRRRARSAELVLTSGRGARLDRDSVVVDAELMVAVEAEVPRHGENNDILVTSASRIDADWLIDLPGNRLSDEDTLEFDPDRERVERRVVMRYGALVIDEERISDPRRIDAEMASAVLAAAAREAGLTHFVEPAKLERWRARIELAAAHAESLDFRLPEDLGRVFDELSIGRMSFSEIGAAEVMMAIRNTLDPVAARALDELAPETVSIPGRKRVPINYEHGRDPWIQSRLQDFFGLSSGPRIAGGRAPLVLHLLAPNRRAVQVTTDLESFWQRHYPELRRQLMRRYPKHAWPEKPG